MKRFHANSSLNDHKHHSEFKQWSEKKHIKLWLRDKKSKTSPLTLYFLVSCSVRGKHSCLSCIIEQPRHLIINDCVPLRGLMNLLSHNIFPMALLTCQSDPEPAHLERDRRSEIDVWTSVFSNGRERSECQQQGDEFRFLFLQGWTTFQSYILESRIYFSTDFYQRKRWNV